MVAEYPQDVDVRLARRLAPQPNFAPLGYVGDPAAFSRETALSDYYLKAPQSDARRILTIFKLETSKRGEAEPERPGQRETNAKGRQVLDRYVLAAGGAERLQAVKSQIRIGQLIERNLPAPLRGVWSSGQWSLTITHGPEFTERFGFNGTYGWHVERGDVGQLPEPLVMLVSRVLDPRLPLHLVAMMQNAGTPREEMFGDRPVLVMEAELKSGAKAVLTFDSKTGLLVRMDDGIRGVPGSRRDVVSFCHKGAPGHRSPFRAD
jgi:hypothetical protein